MGRTPCCDKMERRRGPWTSEEDQILITHIMNHGHGNWRALPKQAGLLRCGKSCRLRWTNFLRPGIRRGNFTPQEVQTIIQLHHVLGNRWSLIASHLPGRTDSDIKNMWNAHLKKRLESKAERKLYTTSDAVQPCTVCPIAFPNLGCNLLQSSDSSRHSKDRQSATLLPCDYDACNAKNNPEFINGESSLSTVTDDGKTGGQQDSDHHAEPPNILINDDKLSYWQPPVVDEMVFWKTQKFGEHDSKLLQHYEDNTALYDNLGQYNASALEDGTAATATGLSWQIIPCCPSQDTGTNDVVDQLPARSDDYCEHRGIEQIISDESSISCQANPHITSSHFAGPHPLPCVPDFTMDVAYFDELWVDFQPTGAIDYSVNFWN